MRAEFQREYLSHLPLPLAQLYSRAHNDKSARSRHDNAYFIFEALTRLAVAPAATEYLREAADGRARSAAVDQQLVHLARPSAGQWLGMLRELARHFGQR